VANPRRKHDEENSGTPAARTGAAKAARPRSLQLDRLIHDRIRLGILGALAVNSSLSFGELKAMLETSDGNLSVHARKLEEARFIACKKSFEGRIPRTEFRITDAGRKALESYLGHMEALIRATRKAP
jgi:DNA-binding HxlR family transcriptional regulator